MIRFDVHSCWTGAVQFTAEIDCAEDAPRSIKLGLAVQWGRTAKADLRDADLSGAVLRDADLSGADLRDADLRDADLRGADINNTTGNSRHVKSLQTDLWPVAYTATHMQIGCQRHPIADWLGFDDVRISDMDRRALAWWRVWKPILAQIIAASPAEATGAAATLDAE